MARVRSGNTRPELAVRSLLHRAGYRFRIHRRNLPGTPDIVLPRHRLAIFVHGCFWHQHPGCRRATLPTTRRDWWKQKIGKNVQRDVAAVAQLAEEGWSVLVIWECTTRRPDTLISQLASVLSLERLESTAFARV